MFLSAVNAKFSNKDAKERHKRGQTYVFILCLAKELFFLSCHQPDKMAYILFIISDVFGQFYVSLLCFFPLFVPRGVVRKKKKRERWKKKNWRETWKSKKKKKLETGEGGGVWNE